MNPENADRNPEITTISIGSRSLRELTIYPLSFGDQEKLSDVINKIISKIVDADGSDQMVYIKVIVEAITKNLGKILNYLVDEGESGDKVLKEMTNNQIVDLATKVYCNNYETILKNGMSLFTTLTQAMQTQAAQLERQSQPSVNTTEATDSNTSTTEAIKPEE